MQPSPPPSAVRRAAITLVRDLEGTFPGRAVSGDASVHRIICGRRHRADSDAPDIADLHRPGSPRHAGFPLENRDVGLVMEPDGDTLVYNDYRGRATGLRRVR